MEKEICQQSSEAMQSLLNQWKSLQMMRKIEMNVW